MVTETVRINDETIAFLITFVSSVYSEGVNTKSWWYMKKVIVAKIQTNDKLSREMGYFIDRRKRKVKREGR